jgi:tetratricopeptide (TPR) repeat protein
MLWENSERIIENNLLYGVGAGNWKIYFPKYKLDNFNESVQNGLTIYQRPHNDFLWVFSEQGVLGIITYLLIFLLILFYLFRIIKNTIEWKDKIIYISFFACILGYLFISAVDYPLERIEHQLILYLIFSIITAKYYHDFIAIKTSNKFIINKLILITIFSTIILFSFIVGFNRYSGEYYTSKLYKAHHKNSFRKMIKIADKSINSFYLIDPMSVPIQWYKGVALFSLGNITEAKKVFEKAYTVTPYNIHVLNNLASCYESLGEHKKAEEAYLQALSISSNFEESLLNLSAVYYNNKEYEKAFKTIDKCNINSTDTKYITFLPVILNSKIDIIVNSIKDQDIRNLITNFKESENLLLNLYFDSKKEKISYHTFLYQYALTKAQNSAKITAHRQKVTTK